MKVSEVLEVHQRVTKLRPSGTVHDFRHVTQRWHWDRGIVYYTSQVSVSHVYSSAER